MIVAMLTINLRCMTLNPTLMEPLPSTLPMGEDTNLAGNERLSKWGGDEGHSSEVIHRGHPQLPPSNLTNEGLDRY